MSYEPSHQPRFGSGYDEYVYGYYRGHPVSGSYFSIFIKKLTCLFVSKGPYDSYENDYNSRSNGEYNQGYQQTPYGYSESYNQYWILNLPSET